jgi:hypothetical protein
MENRYSRALEKLAAEAPRTKTALICSLLPEIEIAMASGKTRKEVWQRLADEGLDVTCKTFYTIIWRARNKRRLTAAPARKMRGLRVRKYEESAADVRYGHDPLANLRRVEESRPGFHFRGNQDLAVLVHGRRESREQSNR